MAEWGGVLIVTELNGLLLLGTYNVLRYCLLINWHKLVAYTKQSIHQGAGSLGGLGREVGTPPLF